MSLQSHPLGLRPDPPCPVLSCLVTFRLTIPVNYCISAGFALPCLEDGPWNHSEFAGVSAATVNDLQKLTLAEGERL